MRHSAQADHETKLSYRGRKCSLTANLKRPNRRQDQDSEMVN